MRYLVVAAHPDDEALGAGATIHKVAAGGHEVFVCILSHWSPTRDDNLEEGIKKSHDILGVKKSYIGDFGCMKFKDADHHEMVRFIEECIKDCQPEVMIVHHPADVHVDHGIASECSLEAAKLPQRQICDVGRIKNVLFMEVPSSTDWNINTVNGTFQPNTFMEISENDFEAKLEAINVYDKVLRRHPHPRSIKSMDALTVIRGSQAGLDKAEAFQSVFRLEV